MSKLIKLLFVGIFLASICADCFAYDQVVYIWQRNWNSNIKEAVSSIQGMTGYFTVLCGDLKFKEGKPVLNSVNIKWDYLNQTKTNVTIAFRINAQASKYFATDAINSLADSVSDLISKTIRPAPKNIIIGIQIDYDCPTSKLADYAKFIKLIKDKFRGFQISFTALPAWLDSSDFPALAVSSDYYVLQVHSFKIPGTLEEALKPFSGVSVSSWIEKASLIGYPFYVSLPTYGYEVSFNENGKFLGLRAETPPINYRPGTKHAIVMTDPMKILAFMDEIYKKKPEHLLGFCWFRLPLKTDEFNWSIDTLKMIMTRKSPKASLESETVSPNPGLYEIYVTNNGQTNLFKDIHFNVMWNKNVQIVHDVISGYKEEELSEGNGTMITGMPPKSGDKRLVAWFRTGRVDINPLKVGEVEGYEK